MSTNSEKETHEGNLHGGVCALGKCAACREAFTDVAQMHTCKGCQGKIHSVVVCKSKGPKVDGHEQDNWCSQECLCQYWPYGGQKPAMPYGGNQPSMPQGGSSLAESRAEERKRQDAERKEAGIVSYMQSLGIRQPSPPAAAASGAPVTNPTHVASASAGGIMTAGGRISDFSRPHEDEGGIPGSAIASSTNPEEQGEGAKVNENSTKRKRTRDDCTKRRGKQYL